MSSARPTTTKPRTVPAPNEMRFLFQDGTAPVAREGMTLVALGLHSHRQRVSHSALADDIAIGTLLSGGNGEIALDDPLLKKGYDEVAGTVKQRNPSLRGWEGVPGQPTPLLPGGILMSAARDSLYPKVPVVVELANVDFKPSEITYPIGARQSVTTTWTRPAVAHLNRDFNVPAIFLDRLATQFAALGNSGGPRLPLVLKLTRMGSVGSAPELGPAFVELARQFKNARASSQGFNTLNTIAKTVAAQLVGVLPISLFRGGLRVGYRESLRQIASLAASDPYNVSTTATSGVSLGEALTVAVLRAFGEVPQNTPAMRVPHEDWAALGAAVFLAGVTLLGYRTGTTTFGTRSSTWDFKAELR
jgi:hypothetical protein